MIPQDKWRAIETAPRDGRLVELTWMENDRPADIAAMKWVPDARNGLHPGKVGFWIIGRPGSPEVTWSEHDGAGPTHWRNLAAPPKPKGGEK